MFKNFALVLLLFFLSACFLRRQPYKAAQFTYSRDGQAIALPLMVPKGFTRQEKTDTAGVTMQTFYYPYGAMLYAAYLRDTLLELQPFNKRLHQPRTLLSGSLVYKGQDENELFYREVRQGNLRIGYRLVPKSVEVLFDSATNYTSLQRQ